MQSFGLLTKQKRLEQEILRSLKAKLLSKQEQMDLWYELYDESMPESYCNLLERLFAHIKALEMQ